MKKSPEVKTIKENKKGAPSKGNALEVGQLGYRLGDGDSLAVIPTTEELVGPHVDGFWKEADRSITECELGAAGVTGAETPTHIPVSCVF
jgi:hypothetical protein